MKTAVIYARYSSDNQTEQSIEGQLRVCNDYAQRNDICVVGSYIDRAKTGTNDNRSEFQKMLKASSKKPWDLILVYKLDRFSRNKYENAMHKKTLRDNGIKLVSATEPIPDSPEGIILESLLEGMAEYYSAELSQKVTRGMNESRLKGLYTGGPVAFGYKVIDKKYYINEDEAKVVNEIFENYAAGVCVKDIISNLTERGILHHGKPFTKTMIYKMLQNERYFGIYRLRDKTFTNIYPAIVPENVYNLVRQRVQDNQFGKHQENVVYLLKNKVRCGYCNKTISSESGTSRTGKINRYYKCTGRKTKSNDCKKSIIRKDILEDLIIETTFKLFDNSSNISKLADKILSLHNERTFETSPITLLEKEKREIQGSINNIISFLEKGIATSSTKNRLIELENKLEEIETNIAVLQSKHKIQITKDDIIKFLRTSLKKEPQLMIKLLIKEIILYDDKIEIYYNYIDNKKRPDDDNHRAFCFYSGYFETFLDDKNIIDSRLFLIVEAFV